MEEKDVISMLEREKNVRDGAPCTIVVQDKVYSVQQISNTVRRKLADLEKEELILARETNGEITI